ncbi:hypothetical protein J1TS5_25840 [Paenibacillus macerans]|uniref:hypothetical protein n=1 Tax=Paenibacillus macerans TaxID=44252 RepID=UPI001AFDF43A|nr:hypothetical protein [Paenibacillus macerans]GIP10414.1 hypothetical protein J1TS5_25840 [Paenibacillus macerans]
MDGFNVLREAISKIEDDTIITGEKFKEIALTLIEYGEFERELSIKKQKLYIRFMNFIRGRQ